MDAPSRTRTTDALSDPLTDTGVLRIAHVLNQGTQRITKHFENLLAPRVYRDWLAESMRRPQEAKK